MNIIKKGDKKREMSFKVVLGNTVLEKSVKHVEKRQNLRLKLSEGR